MNSPFSSKPRLMKPEGIGGMKQCLNFKDSLLVFRTTPACGHCFTPAEMVEVDYVDSTTASEPFESWFVVWNMDFIFPYIENR